MRIKKLVQNGMMMRSNRLVFFLLLAMKYAVGSARSKVTAVAATDKMTVVRATLKKAELSKAR